ncbi:hypothetical protein [Nocardia africana]|uniref:hypothetical protein n=1 Tax=Nocardia africana TaxID=134964 RepID=UPI0007A3E882|nr:hypothetical protein [Nocardia africana]MCC3317394.1 hypothetical protein [Nocardia africana]
MSATTLVLLFQPWLSASGPGGAIRSDAFGRLTGTTETQQDWEGAGLRTTDISGTWAVLTCVAVLATIFAAAAYLRTRVAIFATAAAVASTGMALFVLAEVLYLDNKESEMRAAVADDSSLSGVLRGLFGGAHAAHQLAGAHLDFAAMLAGITAFGAAACVLTNHLRDNPIARTAARPTTISAEAAHPSAPTAPRLVPATSQPAPTAATAPLSAATAPHAAPTAPHAAPTAPHVAPAAPHPAPAASATPPAPVVEFADITAERHEPAPSTAELPPFPVRKQPSWRIVIPAGAVSAHAPARAERSFAN